MNYLKNIEEKSTKTYLTRQRVHLNTLKMPDYFLKNISINYYNEIKLNNQNRIDIIEWMIKKCSDLKINMIGFCKAIWIFDNYLSKNKNQKIRKLKLIAAISIYLSSKLEELNPLSLKQVKSYILKNKYSLKELQIEEIKFLNKINFNFHNVGLIDYLYFFLNNNHLRSYWDNNNKLLNLLKSNWNFLFKIVILNLNILKRYNILEISVSILYLSLKIIEKHNLISDLKNYIKSLFNELDLNKNRVLEATNSIFSYSLRIDSFKVNNYKNYFI